MIDRFHSCHVAVLASLNLTPVVLALAQCYDCTWGVWKYPHESHGSVFRTEALKADNITDSHVNWPGTMNPTIRAEMSLVRRQNYGNDSHAVCRKACRYFDLLLE